VIAVIRAEDEAIDQYKKLIKMCKPIDLVTQDLILEITAQEQAHRRQFIGFLYEYGLMKRSGSLQPQRKSQISRNKKAASTGGRFRRWQYAVEVTAQA
jgi:rubrerythrin